VRRDHYRYQRTIARLAEVQGRGFLTGAKVRLRFRPAPPNTGIRFVRIDLRSRPVVAATIDQVTGVERRTTLGHAPTNVMLVEHVLAALAGLRLDNCYVELNAPEPPGLDGSAQGFVDVLQEAGSVNQPARRQVWRASAPVRVAQPGATLALHPTLENEFKVSYILDYGLHAPIARQAYTAVITPEQFRTNLARCRTFLLESEAVELRRQGLGAELTVADLLVFGPNGPLGNQLRYADEPARHKVLDLVGDLALLGHDLCGHLVAYRSGHALNIELVRVLAGQMVQTAQRPFQRLAA
jgi:UDP-3-O-acyl N-acetylglucosamine deacetylase